MSKFSSFVVGGLIGAGVALLVAPRTGAETRAKVSEVANGLASNVQDFAANADGASVQQAWDTVTAKGEEVINAARVAAEGAYAKVAEFAGEAAAVVESAVETVAATVSDLTSEVVPLSAVEGMEDAVEPAAPEAAEAEAPAAEPVAEAPAASVFASKDDELRAKMEAARQRIAEQIAKNAQEAKAKMESVFPAEPQNADPAAPVAEAAEAASAAQE